jgi:signal transduction histidine kinase/ActR/RegA family two-component response regulator
MLRAVPLSIQVLLAFVGLLIGMAGVLTQSAYTSLASNLREEAVRRVNLETYTRAQALSRLFQLRQQRAEAFLGTLESFCAESPRQGRLSWAPDCVRPMLDDFRRSERALGVLLTYKNRPVRRSGERTRDTTPPPGALAAIVRADDGTVEQLMKARRRDLAVTMRFTHYEVERLFGGRAADGGSADVFLIDSAGQLLTPSRIAPDRSERNAALVDRCRHGATQFVDDDVAGVRSFHSLHPLPELGDACIVARLGYAQTLAPAERLREDLFRRVAWFVGGGIVLSLLAAQWISLPIRKLAEAARRLQQGRFNGRKVSGGPSEVRALGRAFDAMSRDLEDLVAKEQAARREAEKANRAKDDFLATVSHELRTPLSAVLGWAHLLRTHEAKPEEVRHGLAVIERSARAQNRLIDDLLDVSRIASNKLRMHREAVTLTRVVEAAIDQVRPQADVKQVRLQLDLADTSLIYGDPRRLEQVVSNLVSNAIKFTDAGGDVHVSLNRIDRNMILAVRDTGAGISPAFLPYVFEWFRQADPRASSQAGLGLGLGIVHHIVHLHGGAVRAESAGDGHGATFTVTLPVFEPAADALHDTPPQDAQAAAPSQRLEATRILVVEDDDASRELLRLTLERAGAWVETVESAAAARREMQSDPPDVLISDIRMPEEDGYSLIRSLRDAGITTPAIALTAYARREDADEARAAGFQIHLPKPVDAGLLVDAVVQLLQSDSVH